MIKNFRTFNFLEESLELYKQLMPFVIDIRGKKIEFDLGSYTHIVDDKQILKRIYHIKQTIINPDEIRLSHHKKMNFREAYISKFFIDQNDVEGEEFIVVVDRRISNRFWTAFFPTPSYLINVKKGKLIWAPLKKLN